MKPLLPPTVALILAGSALVSCVGQAQERPRPVPPVAADPRPVPVNRPQMRVCDFSMTASGIRLERSTVATGRVKAPPFSGAIRRLEFEVRNAAGAKVYAGALDHPLWKEAESDNPQVRGQRQKITRARPSWNFQIRLPAEASGTRVAFFDVLVEPGKPESRRALGEVPLPAPVPAKRP